MSPLVWPGIEPIYLYESQETDSVQRLDFDEPSFQTF